MKILMLEGSPHRHGSSDCLAEAFEKGAHEAGHEVESIWVGQGEIHPCLGCDHCAMDGPCVFQDEMEGIQKRILDCDLLVFVTPVYYFGMSAQLKAVIDRFYAFNGRLCRKRLKTALIAAAWDDDDDVMRYLAAHYDKLCRYLNFQDQGMVLGTGCGTLSMTKNSGFVEKAHAFGRSL